MLIGIKDELLEFHFVDLAKLFESFLRNFDSGDVVSHLRDDTDQIFVKVDLSRKLVFIVIPKVLIFID